jgi:hypothetical protein
MLVKFLQNCFSSLLDLIFQGSQLILLSSKGKVFSKTGKKNTWVQWLTPVIPASREAEIGRIVVHGSPGNE